MELGDLIDRHVADQANEGVAVADSLSIDGDDDVVGSELASVGGTLGLDRFDLGAAGVLHAGDAALVRGRIGHGDAEVPVDDLATLLELLDFAEQLIGDGDGEADAVGLLLREDDGGVDADDFAREVKQRPAGVTGVDLGGGLDEVGIKPALFVGELGEGAFGGADNADGHGHLALGGHAVGVADGDRPFSPVQSTGLCQRRGAHVARGDFQDRQVGARVGTDHDRGINLAIVGGDPKLLGLADDVLVGENESLGVDEESGTDGSRGLAQNRVEFLRVEALGAQGVIRIDRRTGSGDGHHGGRDAVGDPSELLLKSGEIQRAGGLDVGGGSSGGGGAGGAGGPAGGGAGAAEKQDRQYRQRREAGGQPSAATPRERTASHVRTPLLAHSARSGRSGSHKPGRCAPPHRACVQPKQSADRAGGIIALTRTIRFFCRF